MDTVESVMDELRALGSASIKKVLTAHGAKEPFFGVRIGDMKPIEKRLKGNYELALGLYAAGNSDAMYLAGLITDDMKMTRDDLQSWVGAAYWPMLSESTVPWVASGGRFGLELAREWIESPVETTACAGWRTLSCLTLIKPDAELDIPELERYMDRVRKTVHQSPNRVRYSMNGFVIACGIHVSSLTELAIAYTTEMGQVQVFMGSTSCQVPFGPTSIANAAAKGAIGKKKKTAKC